MACNSGDKADPWLPPTITSHLSDKCLPTFNFFHRSFCMGSSQLKPILLELPCFSLPIPRLRHSVAFGWPTSHMPSFFCLAKHSRSILLDMKIASREHLHGIKPNSVSSIVELFLNLFSSTFLTIFNAWSLLLCTCHSSCYLLFLWEQSMQHGLPCLQAFLFHLIFSDLIPSILEFQRRH